MFDLDRPKTTTDRYDVLVSQLDGLTVGNGVEANDGTPCVIISIIGPNAVVLANAYPSDVSSWTMVGRGGNVAKGYPTNLTLVPPR